MKKKSITILNITAKSHKRHGVTYGGAVAQGQHAEIIKNESIRLFGERNGTKYDVTFKMGDMAEYDSYNLSYYGPIVSITEKTVTIADKYGRNEKKRLDIHTFNWRNHDFNLKETIASNQETSYYI